ncbi:MAG: hypothetical protein WA751_00425 [Candidatus Dormiibacterota bacterium]
MPYAGAGSGLWRVRVDLFTPLKGIHTQVAVDAVRSLLLSDDSEVERLGVGGDSGLGIEGRPVVGLLFWVRADGVGVAASIAVDTAQRATFKCCGETLDLYDVTIIPRGAVILPDDPQYPQRPD